MVSDRSLIKVHRDNEARFFVYLSFKYRCIMTTITINERTKAGKIVFELAKMLSDTGSKGITIDTGLNVAAVKPDAKELTPKQRTWINRLKKVKHDVAAGTFKGQSAQSFLDEL